MKIGQNVLMESWRSSKLGHVVNVRVTQNNRFVSHRIQNIVEKGLNSDY